MYRLAANGRVGGCRVQQQAHSGCEDTVYRKERGVLDLGFFVVLADQSDEGVSGGHVCSDG